MINYYNLLNISMNFSQEELKNAFRIKIKENHPDLFKDNKKKELAEEVTKKIIDGYNILRNIEKRNEYDDKLRNEMKHYEEEMNRKRKEEEQRKKYEQQKQEEIRREKEKQYQEEIEREKKRKYQEEILKKNIESENKQKVKNSNKKENIYCYEFCKECGEEFVITMGEYRFFISHGLSLPKRCKSCRENHSFSSLSETNVYKKGKHWKPSNNYY